MFTRGERFQARLTQERERERNVYTLGLENRDAKSWRAVVEVN